MSIGTAAVGGVGADLYSALGLSRTCTGQDVKRAFRRVALTLHPDRARLQTSLQFASEQPRASPQDAHQHQNHEGLVGDPDKYRDWKGGQGSRTTEDARFALAARAYEVLVDPRTRAAYDLHGHAPLPQYHGDPHRTFRKFFGTDNPFLAQLRDRVHFDVEEPKPPETVVVPVRVTLEEINEGVTKTSVSAVRVPASPGGDATDLVERSFTVQVAPGALAGTRYPFRRQGHQDPGRPPGDAVSVLEEVPHARFTREGADLVQSETVSLREALTGCIILIVTLDGRLVRVAINDIVRPGYEKRVSGEGLPLAGGQGGVRGCLVLRLDVRFPVSLSRPCKALLDQALQLHEEQQLQLTGVATGSTSPSRPAPNRAAGGGLGGVARAILEDKMRREAGGSK